ncbi:hypothetical protein RZS08_17695, partial [Arthrospira platensis SPKY1]|nr:hypothetical protein [Arthrospira platensis SPKY1]
MQVYEDTTGIKPGDTVYGSGQPLSVELGPGLIGSVYDGIQRPLEVLRKRSGAFIERGVVAAPLDREKRWEFSPLLKTGDTVSGGAIIGETPENGRIIHKVLVPPNINGTVKSIVKKGEYTVDHVIAVVEHNGTEHEIRMYQQWPVRVP